MTVLASALPGFAGYATAKFEALDRARQEVLRLQAQLSAAKQVAREATERAARAAAQAQEQAAQEEAAQAAEVDVEMRPVGAEPCRADQRQPQERTAPPVALDDSRLEPLIPLQDRGKNRRQQLNRPADAGRGNP